MIIRSLLTAFFCLAALQTHATTFSLVRHGQTDWNVEDRLQGQSDISLNAAGKSEAAALRDTLEGTPFHACYCSDLKRAEETARILLQSHPITLTTDARLRERDFGPWEGYLRSELPFEEYLDRVDVESDASMCDRIFAFLDEMAKNHPGEHLLIVSHGGVMRNVISHIRSDIPLLFDIKVANMALLEIKGADGHYVIEHTQGVTIP